MTSVAHAGVPTRPAMRYHGGKWRLAPFVLQHFPPHRIYVEPFGGAASVLLRKARSYGEVYNDMDEDVVNVFRVLQDPAKALELTRLVTLTPFARSEFKRSYLPAANDVDAALKMLIRSFMGFGSASMTRSHITGFRANSSRSGTIPAQDWMNWPWQVQHFTERLRGVVIENKDAARVMRQHDKPVTLHYVDPPYLPETRTSLNNKNGNIGHYYRHDLTLEEHHALAAVLHSLSGMVVLSGYPSPVYEELYGEWGRVERSHMADGARRRVEVLWLNPAAVDALPLSLGLK